MALLGVTLMYSPPELAPAGEPESRASELETERRPEPTPPPEKIGSGLLFWGSAGVVLGAGGIAGGALTWWGLGHSGIIGTIPMAFGAVMVGLGGAGIYFGKRRRDAFLDWRHAHQPGHPTSRGTALIGSGMLTLSAGLGLGVFGIADLPPLRTYEPGDDPDAMWMSVTGMIGTVSGVTMVVMGSIQRHRYRHWQPSRASRAGELIPYPWMTATGAGFGIAGRF